MPNEAAMRRRELVDWLVREDRVRDPRVEAALRTVPRHIFLPGVGLATAYADEAIPVKQAGGRILSSASQPSMVAIMLEQLDLRPGHRVLEVGAGTGYNAALMAHLVGSAGAVTTLDLDADLVEQAARNLAAAGYPEVRVVRGDGAYGYSPAAPYDRIVLTVGASDVSPAWVDQLKTSGRLLLPLAIRLTQRSVALEPRGDHLESVSAFACGFVTLRGLLAGPESRLDVSCGTTSYSLILEDARQADPRAIAALLGAAHECHPTGVVASGSAVFDGLIPWLELQAEGAFVISSIPKGAEGAGLLPVAGGLRTSVGLLSGEGLALLGCRGGTSASPELVVERFGSSQVAADRLADLVGRWADLGRPSGDRLRLRVYPADVAYRPGPGESVVTKRWSTLVVNWPAVRHRGQASPDDLGS